MQHLAIVPVVIPLLAAVLLLLPPLHKTMAGQRAVAFLAVTISLAAGALLMTQVAEQTFVYWLGNWQPPFGIILVVDAMSALMVTLCSFLCLTCMLYATSGQDKASPHFYPLFLFQVVGINGAFLTGDLFNLFVFFEVLLIASYSLLTFGVGKEKTRANFHYVTLNLIGSAFFLFALGILYGATGTLNMADLAARLPALGQDKMYLAKAGGLLLIVVFGLKSAMVPLHYWLAQTYTAAIAPVAALFAIMTKVGIYSLMRVHIQIFGDHAGDHLHELAASWLWPAAIATVALGSVGAIASEQLKTLIANLVIVSVGSLLLALAMHHEDATTAAIFYLVHSTLVTGALFLIVDMVSAQRGQAADRLVSARPVLQTLLLGGLYMLAALMIIGMPPFSGFVGKVMLLISADGYAEILRVWPVLLVSSLCVLVAMARAGTTVFWHVRPSRSGHERAAWSQVSAVALLMVMSPLMVVFGSFCTDYAALAAAQLHAPSPVIQTVLENTK